MDERTDNLPAPPPGFGGSGVMGMHGNAQRIGLRVARLQPVKDVTAAQIDQGWRPGFWRLGKTRLVGPTVDVVFLKYEDVRHYDVKIPGQKYEQTVCASANGEAPMRGVYDQQAALCAECPRAQWRDDPTGELNAKGEVKRVVDCDDAFAFLGVIPSMGMVPFWLLCGATSREPARTFLRALNAEAVSAMFDIAVRLGTEEQGEGLKWYTPTFALLDTEGERHELEERRARNREAYAPYYRVAERWSFPFFLYRERQQNAASSSVAPDQEAPSPDDVDVPF